MGRDAVSPPLRVAVLLDGLEVPAWIGLILRRLEAADFVDLRLLVLNGERPARPPLPVRLWRMRRHLLFSVYEHFDDRWFTLAHDPFTPCDLAKEFGHVRQMEVVPERPRPFEHRFDPATIQALRAEKLDVVLRFGFRIIRGEILDVARCGVWSLHHGDTVGYRGGPPFFWEMAEREPATATVLQVLTDRLDAGRVLYRSWSATDRSWLRRGRARSYWKTAHFMERRLRDLHEHGWDALRALPTFDEPHVETPIRRAPSNGRMALFLTRVFGGIGWRILRHRFGRDAWFVGYRPRRGPGGPPVEPGGFTELAPPYGRFYADPFLLERPDDTWLFLEDYDWSLDRAGIAAVRIDGRGAASEPQPVMYPPHHVSYPFVLEVDGDVLLIPESAEARRVEVWRAVELPSRWERHAVLLEDVEAYDPTLVHRDGRWWLFVAIPERGASPDDELHLFSATALDGPWTPHPRNPVVSDVRCARPAGRIVERDGRLLRPAQDGSVRYGGAIVWREIVTLTADAYEERPLDRTDHSVLPDNLATHTYDHSASWEVVDGQRRLRARRR